MLNKENLGLQALRMDTARLDLAINFLDKDNSILEREELKIGTKLIRSETNIFSAQDGLQIFDVFNTSNELKTYRRGILGSVSRYVNSTYFDSKLLHSGGLCAALPCVFNSIVSSNELKLLNDDFQYAFQSRTERSIDAIEKKLIKDINVNNVVSQDSKEKILQDLDKVYTEIEDRLYDYLECSVGTKAFEFVQPEWDFITNEDNKKLVIKLDDCSSDRYHIEEIVNDLLLKYNTNDNNLKDKYLSLCLDLYERLPSLTIIEFNDVLESLSRMLKSYLSPYLLIGAIENAKARLDDIMTNYLTITNISKIINV